MLSKSDKTNEDKFFAVTPESQAKIDEGLSVLARIIARDILRKRLSGMAKINEDDF